MTNQITLDDIRAAAERKYGSFTIPVNDHTTVELRNALRLPKDVRKRVTALQEEMGSDEVGRDQEEILADLLRELCADSHQGNVLIGEVGDDLAVMAMIFEKYSEQTQVGEASPSQD